MDPRSNDTLTVWRGGHRAGQLLRSPTGCYWEPSEDLCSHFPWLTLHLSCKTLAYAEGDSVPPFFANLLPEGARLLAITRKARTSADDMFTLLSVFGDETIGDVRVGDPATAPRPRIEGLDDFRKLTDDLLQEARDEAAIPGVQPKLSASDGRIAVAVSDTILKPEPIEFPGLAENEAATMKLAKKAGLDVAKANVRRDRNDHPALFVERFDVLEDGSRVHVEDGCQVLNRYPSAKYLISVRELAEAIVEWCSPPPPSLFRLIELYAFSYLVGNADLHAKNVSLWIHPKTQTLQLAPAYDLVCTLAYPKLDPRMALRLDGKDDSFRMRDLIAFGERFGLPESALTRRLTRVARGVERHLGTLLEVLPEDRRNHVATTLNTRLNRFIVNTRE